MSDVPVPPSVTPAPPDSGLRAIPVWVIAGPLGVGKTTVITRLLANKPPAEDWVVLLNEFTDAGIDALTVAAAARGAFDVRLIPGGCLCCTGEADFRRTLLELIATRRPARILVEPSGIGHPVGIVEELLAHEARGDLRLEWVLALVDASRLDSLERAGSSSANPMAVDSVAAAAVQIADAVALTKGDRVDSSVLARFLQACGRLYPTKRWCGMIESGHLPQNFFEKIESKPEESLMSLRATTERNLMRAGKWSKGQDATPVATHAHAHRDAVTHGAASESESESESENDSLGAVNAEREVVSRLGRMGMRWIFPRSVAFSRTRLASAFVAAPAPLGEQAGVLERFKAVVRVGEDDWILVQWAEGVLTMTETAWRRDNRLELQCVAGSACSAREWDQLWLRCRVD